MRPSGCKQVVPQEDLHCPAPLSKEDQIRMWVKHQDMIQKALQAVEG
jgi:hypothetical protein